MLNNSIKQLVEAAGVSPVLVDVGSTGETFPPFAAMAPFATLVAFDADSRAENDGFGSKFKEAFLIPKVVASRDASSVEFILARFGECSSTLEPDPDVVGEYIFKDFFTTVGRTTLPAITLNAVLDDLGLPGFDWVKVDSQGTDLRLLQSLREDAWANVLAVDVEPGLLPFYRSEDTFCACHDFLTSNGFFPSDIKAQSFARIRPSTADYFAKLAAPGGFTEQLKRSPICLEARYFRSIQHLSENASKDRLITAFVLGMADDLLGYAMDVCLLYESKTGRDQKSEMMRAAIVEDIASISQRDAYTPTAAASIRNACRIARRKLRKLLIPVARSQ
jgi:hypothetical protein